MAAFNRLLILGLLFLCSVKTKAQADEINPCKNADLFNVAATLKDYSFVSPIHIPAKTLSKGFTVITSDSTLTVTGFRVYYWGKRCDLYVRDVKGDRATPENLPILKRLLSEDRIMIECISVLYNKTKKHIESSFQILLN